MVIEAEALAGVVIEAEDSVVEVEEIEVEALVEDQTVEDQEALAEVVVVVAEEEEEDDDFKITLINKLFFNI